MSIPKFPEQAGEISWDQALSMVVASIAMEELALSHILNAEGEKIQYVLGTLHEKQGSCASTEEILKVNESVGSILDKVETNQMLLKGKLEQAIKANKQKSKITKVLHGIPNICWDKEHPFMWVTGEELKANPINNCVNRKIFLPPTGPCLISYSFILRPPMEQGYVALKLQKIKGNEKETLGIGEGRACNRESLAYISGCTVVAPSACENGTTQIEFSLCDPCFVYVDQATLTVTEL